MSAKNLSSTECTGLQSYQRFLYTSNLKCQEKHKTPRKKKQKSTSGPIKLFYSEMGKPNVAPLWRLKNKTKLSSDSRTSQLKLTCGMTFEACAFHTRLTSGQ